MTNTLAATGTTKQAKAYPSFYPWLVWGLSAAFFFCDYFARVSPGVMVNELMRDFGVTALGLGGLSLFFYYPYVAMQIPVGLLVDKFGVRRLIISMSLLTGIACFLFGSAQSLYIAEIGRALLGFGAAFAFVSALKLASVWFPPSRFGFFAGFTQALGMLGAVVGEAPVSFSVQTIGWRETMFVMAGVFFILSILITLIVQDKPPGYQATQAANEPESSMWKNLLEVLGNPQSWRNAAYAGLLYAPMAAFAELWGVTYLVHTHGLSESVAATANGMMFLGWACGGPFVGWLSDKIGRRKPLMIASPALCTVILVIVLYAPIYSAGWILLLLFLYGICNTGVGLAYAVASEINPRRIAGSSMAFANMMSVIIGALLQPVIGWILDARAGHRIVDNLPHYTAHDYRIAVIALPICSLLAVLVACSIRETHCQSVAE